MNAFLIKYCIANIIRAHQFFQDGAKAINKKLVFVFPAPNYVNRLENKGVAAKLDKPEKGFKTKAEFFISADIDYTILFMT